MSEVVCGSSGVTSSSKSDLEVDSNVGQFERAVSIGLGALMVLDGPKRRGMLGIIESVIGAAALYRGVTGKCPGYNALGINTRRPRRGTRIQKSLVVHRAPETLYRAWRKLSNLPQFMRHLESVTELSESNSRWVAKGPAGQTIEWDATIVDDTPGHHIAWRSLPGSKVSHSGAVGFVPLENGQSTELKISLQYEPFGGFLGNALVSLLGEEPEHQITSDLKRFKQQMEAEVSH